MTKVLNLDELEVGLEKTIKLDGKEHTAVPLSVENYVKHLKTLEALEEEGDIEKSFDTMVQSILQVFPTMKDEQVRALPMPKLNAIFDFIRDSTEEETEMGNVSAGEKK